MLHPDLLLDLAHLQHQDWLREVETWRLVMEARRSRAKYFGHLIHRLIAAARKRLRIQAQSHAVTPDLADLRS